MGSTGNINKRLDDIECSLKKLELNLRLVDEDDIKESEFSVLKDKIRDKCETDKNKEEFLTSMTTKRYNNRLKKIVNYLSFICPVLSIINQTSIPNIISTELAPAVIKDTLTSLHLFAGQSSTKFQKVLDSATSNVDLVDKGLETDLFSLPDNLKTIISDLKTGVSNKGTAVSKSVSKIANDIAIVPGYLTTNLPVITKYVAELCSSLKIRVVGKNISKTLLNKYNILYFTYCLSMFYILLHSKIRLRVDTHNTTNATIIQDDEQAFGGKKSKKVKKSKGSKSKKNV